MFGNNTEKHWTIFGYGYPFSEDPPLICGEYRLNASERCELQITPSEIRYLSTKEIMDNETTTEIVLTWASIMDYLSKQLTPN